MNQVHSNAGKIKIDPIQIKTNLVDFLVREVRRAGLSKGVIGLSGGVDSTLVTYLAAEALGKENVIAVLMPYKTSSPESMNDAKLVIEKLGIRSEEVNITPMVDAYLARSGEMNAVRKGNIMARQRMIVLYDISARENAIVIGTSNKTEILLGYGTLFGDTACGINPIGDLYKTQVWYLAEAVGVPKNIIEKKPTADLWVGQTDEGELGFSYRRVDELLFGMYEDALTDDQLIKNGFEKEFIDKVKGLIMKNEFKRRPPLIAKMIKP
ncbi:MAG: NAD+ synthase [Ignavibacteriales bacterium]|nr:NAD+ synthase [Ignavibacteriales bacterium]